MKKLITLFAIAGMVLALAPAAQALPGDIISGEIATASSDYNGSESWGRPVEALVNNLGMTDEGAAGVHQTSDYTTGWQNGQTTAPWIKVDLGGTSDVGNMYVWNGLPGLPGWGAQTVDIYYATTDPGNNVNDSEAAFNTAGWTSWGTVAGLAQYVSGSYLPTDTIALDVNARYIALNVTAAYTGINNASIAELQFEEGSPAEPTVKLDGGTTGNVDENQPIGTVVGGIGTLVTESWAVTNLSFAGGTDDASFSISGTNLLTAEIFDKETKDDYSIDVKADDGAGTSTTNTFAITIGNVVEPFGGIYAGGSVAPGTTEVATLVSELGDNASASYAIEAGYDGAKFTLTGAGDVLELASVGDATLGAVYWVEVTATGNVSGSRSLLIKVTVDNSGRGVIFIIE